MARLIDADALGELVSHGVVHYEDIMAQPTVDAVPVIRCKDCKRWNTIFDRNTAEYGLCQIRSQLETTRYDEYCSRAERKEE